MEGSNNGLSSRPEKLDGDPRSTSDTSSSGSCTSLKEFSGNNHELHQDTDQQVVKDAAEDPAFLKKVETLSRSLSRRTTTLSEWDEVDENFDMYREIQGILKASNDGGIHLRKAGITARNVAVKGVDAQFLEGATYGDMLMLPATIFKGIKKARQTTLRDIISNVNLLVRPGEMLLVLGRPGSGCSTFLKTMAGELSHFKGVSGDISYDGVSQKDMLKYFKSDVIYNGEMDVHFPHLTVQQTLDFAVACKTPSKRINDFTRQQYIEFIRDLYATIFGLKHTYNTKVGDDFVRGVSGGERKRVSIAEALAARGSIYCWDNATRGLDASTALEYTEAIRCMTNLLKSTALITVYQASENIYETFDKVTILYEGKQIYFGRIEEAKKYFENLGFICPARQATAEFLTSLTDSKGLRRVRPGFENKVPRTRDDFVRVWEESKEYHDLIQSIEHYETKEVDGAKTIQFFKESMVEEKDKASRKKSKFTISYWAQIRLCTRRGFQRIYGDKSFTITNTVAAIIQALVTGSLFYNTPSSTQGAFSRGGVLYFAILYFSLMGLANISLANRPILQKHIAYSLYHPSAEALASTISNAFFRMISLTAFLIILYFLSGLTRNAGRFFMVYLFVALASESINALFEFITAACDSISQANAIAGLVMMALSLYSTYMIQTPSMHPWFEWISYILPLRYAFENMLNAEFHARRMDCGGTLVPTGPVYENVSSEYKVCAFIGSQPGESYVLGDNYLKLQYDYSYSHQWRNFGILIAFLVGFLVFKSVITEFKTPIKSSGDALLFKKGTSLNTIPKDEESNVNSTDSITKTTDSSSRSDDPALFADMRSEGIFLWKDICYTIPYKGGERLLLDNVSGYVKPGTLTALMGESGAGKTTLLNTLAQRTDIGVVTGDMLVNGKPIDASFERRTGYVQQQDVHIKEMTVRESLQFSARMRRPLTVPDEEKLDYVEKVIEILDMSAYGEALVGNIGYGLNVEQRKKLSIAVELVAKPNLLLFLDEPTSGLDSQSAWAIVQLLKKLAGAGQSILCTIHQPSATLFEEFDRLLLLRKGGQTVYFGDIGEHSSTLLSYFERNGARRCEEKENPAEYILEAIGAGATASVKEDWHEKWIKSSEFVSVNQEINDLIEKLAHQPNDDSSTELITKYATPYWYQFVYVLRRTMVMFWRDVDYLMAKTMLYISSGLFIGFTFYNVGTSFVGLQNAMFAAFMACIVSAPAMNQIQARALQSRELYEVRESRSNMFHWSCMLFSQYITELPYQLWCSTLFFVSFYFPLKAEYTSLKAGLFYLNYCVIFQLYCVGLGLAVLYMSPDLPSSNVIMGLLLSFMITFCGVVQPVNLMPGFWTFMWKVSPYTYLIQNFVSLMLHDKTVICTDKELSYFNPPPGSTCGSYMTDYFTEGFGYIKNPEATSNCAYCRYKIGDQYLSYISAKYADLWRNFGFLWVYICFNLIAMVSLYYIFHVKRFSPKSLVMGVVGKFKKEK
ncbi:ATP-binding cassette transporter SNQ2 [Kluyveromyces lactis]|uniref:KLLA0D03432p n=1 Tax=Kluyveromyces lactis (strain ATCC 8585 / CBS 2359 / DSM 70799 / NBRC 1267 / NRRL Y-1140 / WM37) TaxID=284590 RepID=Q6CS70_KLULA|nr:uncharacterized protein KLLA0_D03432g [Kluyveromyces lactis]CAH00315.1 KLLA0D03432p [Kluyveromyces lactis]|eukprot:XP_453219.1 uncharacterized protein KLLA0_D03432g [Kluyveromyces lactis]